MSGAPQDERPIAVSRVEGALAALASRPWVWLLLVLAVVVVPLGRTLLAAKREPLPLLAQVPPFEFTNQRGEAFASSGLAGKVWIANFIFTRCPTICPAFSAKMASLERRGRGLGTSLQLLSFSVDPEHDTPEKLAAYAARYGASPQRWSFLTGPRTALEDTIIRGLKLPMSQGDGGQDILSIGHSGHFVLVDGAMRVRGYYDSTDADAVERLLRDSGRLANGAD